MVFVGSLLADFLASSALLGSTEFITFRRCDLPQPFSPTMTFNPVPNSKLASVKTVKFFTLNCFSIPPPLKTHSSLLSTVAHFQRGSNNAAPGADQSVVSAGFFGPFLALTQGVQVVGKLADGFATSGHFRQQFAGGRLARIV